MRTVYKYGIPVGGETVTVEIPVGAKILHYGEQNGTLFVWAEVDDERHSDLIPKNAVRYNVIGTGQPIPAGTQRHVATIPCANGLVWHVYEQLS